MLLFEPSVVDNSRFNALGSAAAAVVVVVVAADAGDSKFIVFGFF